MYSRMYLLKPILKNPKEHTMSTVLKQVVTIDIAHNARTLKNELGEDEPPAF